MEGPAKPVKDDTTRVAFAAAASDISSALTTATTGLVSREEFARRREELEKAAERARRSQAS